MSEAPKHIRGFVEWKKQRDEAIADLLDWQNGVTQQQLERQILEFQTL